MQGPLVRMKGCAVAVVAEGAPRTITVPLSAGVTGFQDAGDFAAALQVCISGLEKHAQHGGPRVRSCSECVWM